MKKLILAFVVFVSIASVSCTRNRVIDISATDSLELYPGVKWALIHEPYAAFRQEPSFESLVVDHARRGEIMQVLGSQYVTTVSGKNDHTVIWYNFDKGWLDESLLTIFDNKYKAQTVAKTYEN